jgi:hypothetical protein
MRRRDWVVVTSLRVAGAIMGIVGAGAGGTAHAAPPASEDRADALFHEGKRLYDAGEYAASCAKLRESDSLDPAVGTLCLLAACEEKRSHLVEAMRAYREVARRAKTTGDARGAVADKRATELEARIPRIVIEAPEGTQVFVGGREIAERGETHPLRLDPGRVEIQAKRRDGTSWSRAYELAERASVVVVISEDDSGDAPPAGVDDGASGPPIASIVLGGVGIAGLGVMTAFGVSAMAQNGDSEDLQLECEAGDAQACGAGRDAREGAQTASTLATVAFGVGVASLAAAGVVWILDDGEGAETDAARTTIAPGPGLAGLALRRSF